MSAMKELQIVIEEVARIALEDQYIRYHIGHELDLSDEYLVEVHEYLESMLNEESNNVTQGEVK